MRNKAFKFLLVFLLILILCATFVSCAKKNNNQEGTPAEVIDDQPPQDDTPQEVVVAVLSTKGETDAYESGIISSAKLVCGAKDKRIITRTINQNNIDDTIIALKDEGVTVVVSANSELEASLVAAAKLLPKIQFITIGGTRANFENLDNYHNAYISMHEARYLNGVAAGMKLNQYIQNGDIDEDSAMIGFIATEQSTAQISAYTAFYLGAKSVCPTVKMSVKFASAEQDVNDAVNAFLTIGCKIISQYSYDDEIITKACNDADEPIPNVTFISDNSTSYPSSFLTGFNIGWRPYFTYLIDTLDSGEKLATDWCGTIANDSVTLYNVNNTIAAPGTADAIQTALTNINSGALRVFDLANFTVEKCPLLTYIPSVSTKSAIISTTDSSYIVESNAKNFRSYPYFGLLVDGIYYDSNVTIRSMGQYTVDTSVLPPEDDNLSPAEKYFTALLTAAKSFESPTLDTTTDKVNISVSGYFEYDSDIAHSIKRAYDIDLILDLPAINNETDPSFGDSAIKIRLSNGTDSNLFTIWYFTKDTSDTIFIQYRNEYFKVGIGADFDIDAVLDYINSLDDEENQSSNNESGFDASTIVDAIGNFAKDGSFEDYALDKVTIKSILMLFDINIDEYITTPAALTLLGTFGLTVEDVQNMTVEELLTRFSSLIVDEDQIEIKENLDGSTTYISKDFSKRLKNLVNQFANNLLAYVSFGLSFTIPKDEEYFQELTFDFYSGYTNYQHFDLRIHVENIKISVVTEDSTVLLEKAAEYKDYVEFSLNASIDFKNQFAIDINETTIPLGRFDLNAYMALDFLGEGAANKTSIEILLKIDDTQAFRVVLYQGTLCIDVNLTNTQMQAITNVFLKDICDVIKDYTVGTKSNVAFKFIGDVIDELLSKVFDSNGNINTSFVNITINNIDTPVLARGFLYGIMNGVLIGYNQELPIEERAEVTPEASLSVYTDEDKSSLFSFDVQMSSNSILKIISNAISYDPNFNKITISLSNLKQVIKDAYSNGKDSLSSADDIMGYFVGTDDEIIKSLTEHGLFPLYTTNTLSVPKYISAEYTIAQAIADGYTSMPGNAISKTNAVNIWKYVSKKSSSLVYKKVLDFTGSYVPKNGDYATEEEYLNSFIFNRYYNMFKNSPILAGKTNVADVIAAILDGTTALTLNIFEEDDAIDLSLTMLGQTFTADIDYDIKGVNLDDIEIPTLTDTSAIANGNKVVVTLDEDFYTLFKAVYGMGYGTSLAKDLGTNYSLYYIATSAEYDTEENEYTSIELSGNAIIILDATTYRLITPTGSQDGTYTIDEEANTFTSVTLNSVADGTVYNILGSKFRVLIQQA